MAKSLLRLEARKLRKIGVSVRKISQTLHVSKDSASRWTRDIILTVEQLESLRQSSLKGAELGRLRSALLQKHRRLDYIEGAKKEGIKILSKLSEKELLIAGLAIYWGEGCRKEHGVELCNSDPAMIKFFITWLRKCFDISIDRLWCRIGINETHSMREPLVREYWSRITGVPLSQFNNTSFKRIINKKVYENFNEHYGTLTVRVTKPGNLYHDIMGLVSALPMAV